MQAPYIRKNAIHFFKKGIALSLLIFADLTAHASPSNMEAPYSKGKIYSSSTECAYSFLPADKRVTEGEGNGEVTVTVTTGTDCPWETTSNVGWITVISGSGTGNGTVTYSYKANMSESRRMGILTIAGETYTVTQAGRPLVPDAYEGNGGNNTPGTAHLLAADFSPRLQPNAIAAIDIPLASCHEYDDIDIYKINLGTEYTYTLSGTLYDSNHQNDGSNYTLDVKISYSTDNGVNWSNRADSQLLPATVPGGTLYLKIQPYFNIGGTGTYAAKIEIVAGCNISLPVLRKTVTSVADSEQITTIVGSSCAPSSWTAFSNADWLTFTATGTRNATGTGNIGYSYTENPAADLRTGTITVGSQTCTVTQAPPPDRYEPNNTTAETAQPNSPSSFTPEFNQNASVINISPANCHAVGDVDIYKINLASSQTYTISGNFYDLRRSNDGIPYTLEAKISYSTDGDSWIILPNNDLSQREVRGSFYLKIEASGSGDVGTYAVEINIVSCTYVLGDTGKQATPEAGRGEITVRTSNSCVWNAASSAPWITIDFLARRGVGNGTVRFSYTANTATASRTGTITISGLTYTVTQAGLSGDSYEPNNTVTDAQTNPRSSFTPTFIGNEASFEISSASCHDSNDVDIYKINLLPGYEYEISGELYDWYHPNGDRNYTLRSIIRYSTNDGGRWSLWTPSSRPKKKVPGGNLYLKIQGFFSGDVGTYAAKIDIMRISCAYTFSPASGVAEAIGGTGEVAVTTTSTCAWTAVSNTPWITVTRGQSGIGAEAVAYSCEANMGLEQRTGAITIAGQTYTVTQAAAALCTLSLSKSSAEVSADASLGTAEVTTTSSCLWAAIPTVSWITVNPTSGTRSATVTYSIAENTGAERRGIINIAGKTLTVTQAAASCTLSLSKYSAGVSADATIGTAEVTTMPSCRWTAIIPDVNWITVRPASGAGNATVTYSIDANTGAARTGSITISGKTLTVTQAEARCTLSLSEPSARRVSANASTGEVRVITMPSCQWTALSNVDWITVRPASGAGNETVTYSIARSTNTESNRTGTITIAGQTLTVTQATAPCTFSLSKLSEEVSAEASSGRTVKIMSGAPCTWDAISDADWITNISPPSGRGNATVTYSIAKNIGAAERTGTLSIGGKPYKVKQAGIVTGFETVSPVKIYPNPAKDFVTIDWTGKGAKCTSVKIVNQFGQILYETKNPGRTVQIPLKGFVAGLYFILLQEEEKTAVQKLIVND